MSRLRALATTGDLFAPDPKCYLRADEIDVDDPEGDANPGRGADSAAD